MDDPAKTQPNQTDTRREFIRGSSMLLASALPAANDQACDSRPVLRLGLIGCGATGTRIVGEALSCGETDVQLVALADTFADRLQQAARTLKGRNRSRYFVDRKTRFVGRAAYQELLNVDLDLVVVATPTCFRALHFEHAVNAGKHVCIGPVVATDLAGVSRFQSAYRSACAKALRVAVRDIGPFSRNRQVLKTLQDGAIGRILSIDAVGSVPELSRRPSTKRQPESEHQLRNWKLIPALGGPRTLQQHVLMVDFANRLFGSRPNEVRTVPAAPRDANNLVSNSQHACYVYADRRQLTCGSSERQDLQNEQMMISVIGTKGRCDVTSGKIFDRQGKLLYRIAIQPQVLGSPVKRIADSIRGATSLVDGNEAAQSTRAAILGHCQTEGSTNEFDLHAIQT